VSRAYRRRWHLLLCAPVTLGTTGCGTSDAPVEERTSVAQGALESEPTFAVYASDSISIGQDAHIAGGQVGVMRTVAGPSLVPGYELAIGAGASVSATEAVHGNALLLGSGATLGEIHANSVVDNGATHGPVTALGSMPAMPKMARPSPTTVPLHVTANAVTQIPANARYGAAVVEDRATLRLAGGVYDFASLTLGENSRLETDAPTIVRIQDRLATGPKAFVGPTTPKTVALNLQIEVNGGNGIPGSLTAYPRAAFFGEKTEVRAVVLANNGTLTLSEKIDAYGAFYAREVDIEPKVDIIWPPGIPAPGPCSYMICKFSEPNGKIIICYYLPVPPGQSCADNNLCNGEEVCDGLGTCLPGVPEDDGNPCTGNVCNPETGETTYVPLPFGSACDDGSDCDGVETCDGTGTCTAGIAPSIDDGDACTADTCDELQGVRHVLIDIDDGDPGTMDWCDPETGAVKHTRCDELDPTVPTQLIEAARCIYEGPEAPQTNIHTQLDPVAIGVVRGKVIARDGAPIPGVRVSILGTPGGTPEPYGHSFTQNDGEFALALNGGAWVTLAYEKQGYLPAQRLVRVEQQKDGPIDDVVLVPFDLQAMEVQMGASGTQIARGSLQSDADGARQATLLFPPNTTATMSIPNPSGPPTIQPLSGAMTVRATEYTVGPTGVAAMPATLPPASGYTYAVELSADEAVQAGATQVDFSQPIPFYLENFLGFPTGMDVPVGVYDRSQGQWIPETDGRIIKVLSVSSGVAVVSVNASETAATPAELASLGISTEELGKLAILYPAGSTLWRVRIGHFSPWDMNWPYGPPPKACAPDDDTCPLDREPEGADIEDEPCTQSGSIIECENQILGERIPVAGTTFTLNYRSDRAFGRKDAYTLSIPLTGLFLPPIVTSIVVRVTIAGYRFEKKFACPSTECGPNQSYAFTWDGFDGQTRVLHGAQPAEVEVGYTYVAEYKDPALFEKSFGAYGGRTITGDSARGEIVLWKTWQAQMGAFTTEALGLGGWTLDQHHVYDPIGRVLYRGDGGRESGRLSPPILRDVASTGLGTPEGIAVGADGSILVADSSGCVIRRIRPNGTIDVVAGQQGQCADAGDGLPATSSQVKLNQPTGVALGPDGSIYIQEINRIRRIGPDGIIGAFAGNGQSGLPGDDVPALSTPVIPLGIAVSSAGDLYIASAGRILRVDAAGTLTIVAGRCEPQNQPPAPALPLARYVCPLNVPQAMSFGPDGCLYVAENNGGVVDRICSDGTIEQVAKNIYGPTALAVGRDGSLFVASGIPNVSYSRDAVSVVSPDGTLSLVAGRDDIHDPCSSYYCGIDGPARAASLNVVNGMAVAQDGSILLADRSIGRITRITPSLPGVSVGKYLLPNETATEIYELNPDGRHMRTIDALTGATLLSFAYEDGRLASVTDRDNLVTTIQHDAATGKPTAIVAPFLQATTLGVDNEGYLNLVENPEHEAINMTYHPGTGLLATLEDAKLQAHEFYYDATGRLEKDVDPAQGSKTLVPTDIIGGHRVTVTTKLNRTSTYEVATLPDIGRKRTFTGPDGLSSEVVRDAAETRVTKLPDGTTVTRTTTGDPRFGLIAPIESETTTTGGKTRVIERARTVTLQSQNDPTSLASIQETMKRNGKTWTTTFQRATLTETTTTPEGRLFQRVFDSKGRVASVKLGNLLPVELHYDGSGRVDDIRWGTRLWDYGYHPTSGYLLGVTNPLIETTTLETDAVGRVTKETRPDTEVISLGYDANGNPDEVTPPGQPLHGMTYTPLDRLGTYTAPPATAGAQPATTTWAYDLDGQMDTVTRSDTGVIDYTPDSAGRIDTIDLPSGQGLIDYAYDPTTGHVQLIKGPAGLTLTMGRSGKLLHDRAWSGIGYPTGTVHHDFDNDFRIASETVNSAQAVAFHYDDDGLLDTAGPMTLARNPATGLLDGSTVGGVVDSYIPNGHGEVKHYEASFDGAPIYVVDYIRDDLGRIDFLTESIDGQTRTFDYVYDAAGRLTDVLHTGGTTHYELDGNGNRLARTTSSGTEAGSYDDQDRLISYGNRTYTFTDAGELERVTALGVGISKYTYDALGSLRHVELPNGTTIDYVVDGEGRRIWKKRNGVLEQGFLYSDELRPVAELDGAGNVVSRFIYGRHRNVPDAMVKGGRTYRIVTDHLGSPRIVIDAQSGAVAQRIDYDEFGRVIMQTSAGFQPFGFAGGIYDRDTGFVRFGARDYDAFAGRWTAKDPLLFGGGDENLYSYCRNEGVNCKDPNGKFVHVIVGGVAVGELIVKGLVITGALVTAEMTAGAARCYQKLIECRDHTPEECSGYRTRPINQEEVCLDCFTQCMANAATWWRFFLDPWPSGCGGV